MYKIKDKTTGEIVAICSRKEDATAFLAVRKLDKTIYIIEKEKS